MNAEAKSLHLLPGSNKLVRIFLGESDKKDHQALYLYLLEQARKIGLAGCSVFRGTSGFGMSKVVHSDFPPDYAEDLPIIVELLDTEERVDQFLDEMQPVLNNLFITTEKLHVHHYRHVKAAEKGK